MRLWLIFLFLSLQTLPLLAQHTFNSIFGSVKSSSGEALFGATVVLTRSRKGTQTDIEGNFSLSNISNGSHTLTASYIGFKTVTKTIELKEGQNIEINFILTENTEKLDEVTVSGKSRKTALETKGFSVNAIETQEAGLRSIQTNELLNATVGVKIRQNGGLGSNVEYSLNGLSGRSVSIFIDGIPISVYGSSFSLNSIPPSLIKNIEVYKGVVPGHLSTDAVGGAINVILRQEARNDLNASVSYGSFNTLQTNLNGTYRLNNSGFTVKASAFHNYSDNDYKISGGKIVDIAPNGIETPITAKRFNDAYRSTGGMVQIGYTDVSWADQLLIGVTASDEYNEVQHGTFITVMPTRAAF